MVYFYYIPKFLSQEPTDRFPTSISAACDSRRFSEMEYCETTSDSRRFRNQGLAGSPMKLFLENGLWRFLNKKGYLWRNRERWSIINMPKRVLVCLLLLPLIIAFGGLYQRDGTDSLHTYPSRPAWAFPSFCDMTDGVVMPPWERFSALFFFYKWIQMPLSLIIGSELLAPIFGSCFVRDKFVEDGDVVSFLTSLMMPN